MRRFDAIQEIACFLTDELVVCNLGYPARELYALQDRPENFYMLGSMGLASSIGLGIAIAQPNRRVMCIEGDGSILMNLGSLATIANIHPPNLTLVVIDNGTHGSTGDQPTATSGVTRLDILARGAGFKSVTVIQVQQEICPTLSQMQEECHFILIKVEPGNAPVDLVPFSPEAIKERFMQSLIA
ncbi:MAG TPA: sulfopyruvate decarboxylase subunit beta [Candidatus Lokiarchaeia archaeon]|nr:sulfopyruvate decarboxylase subunit beta [Candidatus Lokiarchaeia archaeon]